MTMFAKTHSRRNTIFIDDAQIAPAHKCGIIVASKGEGMKAFEPAMIGIAPILGFSEK